MQKVIEYNYEQAYPDDYAYFYEHTRGDANFAAVFEDKEGDQIAFRDHLGVVPLYYRKTPEGILQWSCTYDELLQGSDKPTSQSVHDYLGFPSAKVTNLIEDIHIVPPGTVLRFNKQTKLISTEYVYHLRDYDLEDCEASLVETLEKLLVKAVERCIQHDEVGVYLSGGMDSGLMCQILNKVGIKMNSYTALPWGKTGTEYAFTQKNIQSLSIMTSNFVDVSPDDYSELLEKIPKLYRTPHGTTTALSIAALWHNTDIAHERQIFYAQNTDTFTSSVSGQVNTYVVQKLPKIIRQTFFNLPHTTLLENYIHHCPRGRLHEHPYQSFVDERKTPIHQLAAAGMYIAHTQADAEINAPSIANHQLASNPYYDMDLIEWYLSLPWLHKVSFNLETKTKISIEKKLFRKLAYDYLPKDLVNRKKGFVLPANRNTTAKQFYKSLPATYLGVQANNQFEKLSLEMLRQYFLKK